MEGTKQPREPRRSNYNFDDMGIPIGSKLKYKDPNKQIDVIVVSSREVEYNGEKITLHPLTKRIYGKKAHPCRHWKYNGILLHDLYNKVNPKHKEVKNEP